MVEEIKIIVIERDNEIKITNEDLLTKEFHEQYKENGNEMDKYEFYCKFFYFTPINGDIYYSEKDDAIKFEYSDWDTEGAYEYIKLCSEYLERDEANPNREICLRSGVSFTKYTMSHVLSALDFCGAIGKREYEALHKKYCNYGE